MVPPRFLGLKAKYVPLCTPPSVFSLGQLRWLILEHTSRYNESLLTSLFVSWAIGLSLCHSAPLVWLAWSPLSNMTRPKIGVLKLSLWKDPKFGVFKMRIWHDPNWCVYYIEPTDTTQILVCLKRESDTTQNWCVYYIEHLTRPKFWCV